MCAHFVQTAICLFQLSAQTDIFCPPTTGTNVSGLAGARAPFRHSDQPAHTTCLPNKYTSFARRRCWRRRPFSRRARNKRGRGKTSSQRACACVPGCPCVSEQVRQRWHVQNANYTSTGLHAHRLEWYRALTHKHKYTHRYTALMANSKHSRRSCGIRSAMRSKCQRMAGFARALVTI